jgi:hypothetical protein
MGKYRVKEFIIETQAIQGDVSHITIIPTHPCGRISPEDMKMVQEYIENIPVDFTIPIKPPFFHEDVALMVARGSGKTRYFQDWMCRSILENSGIGITAKKVIFHDPATIVFWTDGTKTVVKCQPGDTYSKEMGLALCFSKKMLGNQSNFNNVFNFWLSEE